MAEECWEGALTICVCVCWERGQVGISMVAERYLKPVLGRILALPQVLSPTAERERERNGICPY